MSRKCRVMASRRNLCQARVFLMLKPCDSMSCRRALLFIGVWLVTLQLVAQTNQAVYTDSTQNGWDDTYSWATINDANTSPVHQWYPSPSASRSSGYEALYIHHAPQPGHHFHQASLFGSMVVPLWRPVRCQRCSHQQWCCTNSHSASRHCRSTPGASESISFSLLGASNMLASDGFWMQDQSGSALTRLFTSMTSLLTGLYQCPARRPRLSSSPMAAGDHHGGCRAESASHQPAYLWRGFWRHQRSAATQCPAQPPGRQHHDTLQLGVESLTITRLTIIYASLPAENRIPPRVNWAIHSSASRMLAGGAQPSLTIPMIDWVWPTGNGRPRPHLELFDREIWGAAEKRFRGWLAGHGQRHPPRRAKH